MHKNGGNSHSYFFLGFVARARDNFISSLLSSNSLYRTVVETDTTLYSRAFLFLRYMIVMVSHISWLISIHSLSVELRGASVLSCDFHIIVHSKFMIQKIPSENVPYLNHH